MAAVPRSPTDGPDVALANHLVMGPVILARALGGRVPYAVKVHGSALEYTVRPHRERFLPYALRGPRAARAGCWWARATPPRACGRSMDDPALPDRTRLGPPGVDVHAFRPAAARRGRRAARRRWPTGSRARHRRAGAASAGAADALRALDPRSDRIVSYVGKLIVSKGVDLLLAAWPLVVARVPDARLVHGRLRHLPRGARAASWTRWRRATSTTLREIAARGRELEGGPRGRAEAT